MRYTLHISPKETGRYAQNILNPIKFGENGIGLCYPGCFIGYTIHAFMDSPVLLKKYLGAYYKKYFFIPIELTPDSTKSTFLQETKSYILEKLNEKVLVSQTNTLTALLEVLISKGYEPYFFLLNTHCVDQKTLQAIIDELYTATTIHPRSGMQVFTEGNIFDTAQQLLFKKYHRLQQNFSIFPAFSERESTQFVHNLTAMWNIKLQEKEIQNIVHLCGGYLWLLREAVRCVRDGHKPTHESILSQSRVHERASYIYSLLDTRCKEGMHSLCVEQNENIANDMYQFLTKTALVYKKNNQYKLTNPLLGEFIETDRKRNKLQTNHNILMYNDKPIEQFFSTKELQVIQKLIDCRGTVIHRDTIATILWGTTDTYSDWAIDKMLSRIRHTLCKIGLPKNTIITKKRQGFLMQ
jgi:hypothetical protein